MANITLGRGRIVKDSGWNRHVKSLLRKYKITVGIHAKDSARPKETRRAGGVGAVLTNVELGMFAEFGTSISPQREWLRITADKNRVRYRKALRTGMEHVAKGRLSGAQVAKLFGMLVKSDIKQRIRGGIAPPNTPATTKRKGSSVPLIDSAQFINSIDSEVSIR